METIDNWSLVMSDKILVTKSQVKRIIQKMQVQKAKYNISPKLLELKREIMSSPQIKQKWQEAFKKQLKVPENEFDKTLEWYLSKFSDNDYQKLKDHELINPKPKV